MGEFGFAQSLRKQNENEGKMLLDKTYYEESNINRKPLIWSQDKIITKFGQKKWARLVLAKVCDICSKVRVKCYLTKLILKRVIST